MKDTLKIKRHFRKSAMYYFHDLFFFWTELILVMKILNQICWILELVSHKENIEQKLFKTSDLTEEIGELIENDAESEDNFKKFMKTDSDSKH